MPYKNISVIGLGYIGLPTAAMFASKAKKVIGVDVNQKTVDIINAGNIHIVEPDLDVIVKEAVLQGYLRAVTTSEPADAFLIAVPTPFKSVKKKGSIPQPDLSYIEAAAKSVARVLKKGDLVILESTSPVGTTEQMASWLADARPDLTFPQINGESSDIRVAYCPERVLPGHVVRELIENDRVIGGMTHKCSAAAADLYKTFVNGKCIATNARTAEMAKLTENASRDVNIAFANELSVICDNLSIDVWDLISLTNLHPRVNILQPGPGVGGHCIAVDPWFIVAASPEDSKLIKKSREINDSKPDWVVSKVKLAIERCLGRNNCVQPQDLKVACYGLAFKANINDLRESPAVSIAKKIIEINRGQTLLVEPNILKIPKELSGGKLVNFSEALSLADIHLLLVDHYSFKSQRPSFGEIIDTRGIWNSNSDIV